MEATALTLSQGRHQHVRVRHGVLHDDGLAGSHGDIAHKLRVVGQTLNKNKRWHDKAAAGTGGRSSRAGRQSRYVSPHRV